MQLIICTLFKSTNLYDFIMKQKRFVLNLELLMIEQQHLPHRLNKNMFFLNLIYTSYDNLWNIIQRNYLWDWKNKVLFPKFQRKLKLYNINRKQKKSHWIVFYTFFRKTPRKNKRFFFIFGKEKCQKYVSEIKIFSNKDDFKHPGRT